MTIDVVVGGQFGSESKGRVTASLVQRRAAEGKEVVCVRIAGPNAGHVVTVKGEKFAMRQIPVGFIEPECLLYIGPGSEIDPQVLWSEVEQLEQAGYDIRERLVISPEATLICEGHKEQEAALVGGIGSTGKGIGAARADRLMRNADRVCDRPSLTRGLRVEHLDLNSLICTEDEGDPFAIVVEGTQGYGLGLRAGFYPQCTSSDCRAIDFLAMGGVNPWNIQPQLFTVWVVARVYPIRVAGNSGPLKGETMWDKLGLEAERTTVTQKIRRVGEWDPELIAKAVTANGPSRVKLALAMVDQKFPEIAGFTSLRQIDQLTGAGAVVLEFLDKMQQDAGAPIAQIGTGPESWIWTDKMKDFM